MPYYSGHRSGSFPATLTSRPGSMLPGRRAIHSKRAAALGITSYPHPYGCIRPVWRISEAGHLWPICTQPSTAKREMIWPPAFKCSGEGQCRSYRKRIKRNSKGSAIKAPRISSPIDLDIMVLSLTPSSLDWSLQGRDDLHESDYLIQAAN